MRRLRAAFVLLRGLTCSHRRMRYERCSECVKNNKPCGNLVCPDCGLYWNDWEPPAGQ